MTDPESQDLERTINDPRDGKIAVNASTVQLFYNAPPREYQIIKEISVEAETPKQAEFALIKKAEGLGADAILLNGFPKFIKNHSFCLINGKAIKYI